MIMLIRMTFALLISSAVWAASAKTAKPQDVLVKLNDTKGETLSLLKSIGQVETLTDEWVKLTVRPGANKKLNTLQDLPGVAFVQPNYAIHLLEDYSVQDPLRRAIIDRFLDKQMFGTLPDNPPINAPATQTPGADPLFSKQWGMNDIGVMDAWTISKGSPDMVVAVIDTGVDYTHPDLAPNMWRNPGETGTDAQGRDKSTNGVDDDGNGFVDDVVGWDFVSNDNKPYDLAYEGMEILNGGNPGHGTHCAGNVAARGGNSIGVSGVAPNVKIMGLRFITERGSGTTADAIKAVKYAVDNGAKVLSNSWGSEGEDPNEAQENKALRDIVQYAQDRGVLFIAAAGNGHKGVGYDNDTDKLPSYPASYDHDNIVSVAALDVKNDLGSFSNWGRRTVDIGAPGVDVFSTVIGSKGYSNVVYDKFGIRVTWDGTSMATPHVAGAAALYWSANPTKTWQEVKAAMLSSAKKIPSLSGKVVSQGKLDVKELLKVR